MRFLIVPLLVASLTFATAQADNDRQDQGQGQGQGQGADKSNHGQVVSECNHRANERKLKGQDRKEFVEWCESRGARYGYDDNRYSRERECYRKADNKELKGDKRQKFLANCLDVEVAYKDGKGTKDKDSGDEQYHPKVREAVENSQKK
jgi:hypothetical protein